MTYCTAQIGTNYKAIGINATTLWLLFSILCKKMFEQLESIPLFRELDSETLKLLAPLFEDISCSAENNIFEQGQPARYLYLLLDGSVEVNYKPYDGPAITITTLKKGSIFGWSAAIGNRVYTSSAICKEDCRAIRMKSNDLLQLCMDEPEAGHVIMNLLANSVSNRWANAQEQIEVLLKKNLKERL